MGLSLEARIYSSRIELIHDSQVVANHLRLWGKKAQVKIDLTHIIAELCKKPGVSPEWKHKQILFSHLIWNRFYEKLKMQQDSDSAALREYLKCLKEMTDHGKENVTAAMELCLEEDQHLSSQKLKEVLAQESIQTVLSIKPVRRNLKSYYELFNFKKGTTT